MGPANHFFTPAKAGEPLDCSGRDMSSSEITSYLTPAEGYRLWADTYDDECNPMLSLEQRILEPLLPSLAGLDVIDLGCGTGRWLSALKDKKARSLVGVDFSPEMLRVAQSKLDSAANIECADCENASLQNSSADLILCNFVLSYIEGAANVLEIAGQALRPGGSLFITDIHPQTSADLNWRRGVNVQQTFQEIRTQHRTIRDVIDLCEKANLQVALLIEQPFGDEERITFEKNGKVEYFDRICERPAIYVLQVRAQQKSFTKPVRTYTQPAINSIRGARFALGPADSFRGDVGIESSRIDWLSSQPPAHPRRTVSDHDVDLQGFMVLPGLINAHDHLEFALFPRLGKGGYKNFMQWANDIHGFAANQILEHRRVPRDVRLWWGGIRNLLCGVTTVCHHNPYEAEVFTDEFVIRVLRDYGWAHSLPLDPEADLKKSETPERQPFFIHLAEGIDEESAQQLFDLHSAGALDEDTVIIHGLGLGTKERDLLRLSGAGLIWCPSSNLFLFGKTLSPEQIREFPKIAIGSDSPLTAQGDLLDEIGCANRVLTSSAADIYQYVTRQPAKLLHLPNGEGNLRIGGVADLLAVRDTGLTPAETLVSLSHRDVELVLLGGCVQLASAEIMRRLPASAVVGLQPLTVNGIVRWIRAPVDRLLAETSAHLGEEIYLGGKRVSLAA
jgi:cytosine/adenosine deaminase-related metal-dependent hydrolase/ubiquinone/menaquinone biosynthesis C-methylase UbiE